MKALRTTLAVLAVVAMAVSVIPFVYDGQALSAYTQGGNWEEVCCGPSCVTGMDYCLGTGEYVCCKP